MNKKVKEFLDKSANYEVIEYIENLQQENKQLKEKLDCDLQWALKYEKQVGNWNKLKEYLTNLIPTDKTVLTKCIKIFEALNKIQELEQGSDSDE